MVRQTKRRMEGNYIARLVCPCALRGPPTGASKARQADNMKTKTDNQTASVSQNDAMDWQKLSETPEGYFLWTKLDDTGREIFKYERTQPRATEGGYYNAKSAAKLKNLTATAAPEAPTFEIKTGLIGAGFFAKCGSVYTGGWSTERKAFNAARAQLRKRNPNATFKQILN